MQLGLDPTHSGPLDSVQGVGCKARPAAAWPPARGPPPAGLGSRATSLGARRPVVGQAPADHRDAFLRSPAVRQRPPPDDHAHRQPKREALLRRERDQRLRLLLGLSPVAEKLMEGPIAEQGLRDRVGMGERSGGGDRLALPRPCLLGVAEGEERVGEPVQQITRESKA